MEELNSITGGKGSGTVLSGWTAPDGSAYTYGDAMVLGGIPVGSTPKYYLVEIEPQSQKNGATETHLLTVYRRDASVDVNYVEVTDSTQTDRVSSLTRDNDTANFIARENSFTLDIETVNAPGQAYIEEFKGIKLSSPVQHHQVAPYALSVSAGANETASFLVKDVAFYKDDDHTPNAKHQYSAVFYRATHDVGIGRIIAIYDLDGEKDVIREAAPRPENPTVYEVSVPENARNVKVGVTAINPYTEL